MSARGETLSPPMIQTFGFLQSGVLQQSSSNGDYTTGTWDIPPTSEPLILFDEEVSIEIGAFINLYKEDGTIVSATKQIVDYYDPTWNGGIGRTYPQQMLRINPSSDLDDNTTYYVLILSGAIENTAGTAFAGITSNTGFRFTTNDVEPPILVSRYPEHAATNVLTDSDITLTFDEDVQVLEEINSNFAIDLVQIQLPSGNALSNVPITTSASGSTVTISPNSNLTAGASYAVRVGPFAIADLSSNSYNSPFVNNTVYQFTTELPNNAPTNISLTNSSIQENNTVDQIIGSFSTTDADGSDTHIYSLVAGSGSTDNASFDIDGSDLIASEIFDYETKTDYSIKVQTDDQNGGTFEKEFSISITNDTGDDNSAPTDIMLADEGPFDENQQDPTEGLTLLETTDADVEDSHTYSLVAGDGFDDADNEDFEIAGSLLRSKSAFDFEDKSSYAIRIQTDDGNGGTFSKAFTINVGNIVDESPPEVTSLTPSDDTFNVALDANLVMNFSEVVAFENDEATFQLRTSSPDALVESFGVGQVSGSGTSTISIDPANSLQANTDYYVLISGDFVFQDNSGNAFEGFETSADWNFSTSAPPDVVAPTASSFEPANGTIDVSISTEQVMVTFNEDIQFQNLSDNNGGRIQVIDNVTNPVYAFGVSEVSIDGGQLAINTSIIPGGLVESTNYRVQIYSTFIEDLAGNDFAGFTLSSWTFTTEVLDNAAPNVASLNPSNGESDVAVDATLVLTFNEDVQLARTGIGVARIYNGDGTLFESFNTSSAGFHLSGDELTLTPASDFEEGSPYYVWVDYQGTKFIEDLAGNDFAGFQNGSTWSFVTEYNQWDGSWSTGTPTASSNVLFLTDYDFESSGDLEVNDLTIANGVSFNVDEGSTLIINGDIDNNGIFTVESGASLISFEGNTVDGNILVERKPSFGSSDRGIGKYSFVSLPVKGTTNQTQNLGDLVYEFTEADEDEPSNGYDLVPSGTIMGQAKGYAVAFSPEELTFIGQPATGNVTISVPSPQNSGFHLIGNPYSAAISVSSFFADNAFASSIAIWDDGGGQDGGTQTGSFIQVNDLGSVTASSNLNGNSYNGHIGSAQGFFVETTSSGSLVFAEDQRVSGSNADNTYFRKADFTSLKLSISNGSLKKETLIALHPEATDGVDIQMDATLRRADYPVELYSLLGNEKFAIQAVYPEDLIAMPLGFSVDKEGAFEVTFHSLNRLHDYEVILVDQVTKSKVQVVEGSSYSFESDAGTFNDRFVLNFSNTSTLLSSHQLESKFQIIPHMSGLELKSSIPVSGRLVIHTMDGRRIFESEVEATTNTWIKVDLNQNQLYLIQIDDFQLKFLINQK